MDSKLLADNLQKDLQKLAEEGGVARQILMNTKYYNAEFFAGVKVVPTDLVATYIVEKLEPAVVTLQLDLADAKMLKEYVCNFLGEQPEPTGSARMRSNVWYKLDAENV